MENLYMVIDNNSDRFKAAFHIHECVQCSIVQ